MLRTHSDECFWNNLLVHEADPVDTFQPAVAPRASFVFCAPALAAAASVRGEERVEAPPTPPTIVGELPGSAGGAARKRNTPYAPWTLAEDCALVARLHESGVAGNKLGEKAMQQLGLGSLPELGQRSFKAIYNRYNKHLQWRAKRAPKGSLAWLREMHEAAPANEEEERETRRRGASKRSRAEATESPEQTLDSEQTGRELVQLEGARLAEGELWLEAHWSDGTSEWQRAASLRDTEFAPALLDYYEGLVEQAN